MAITFEALDCGDNSCEFAEVKGGMRTNGGCRCLDEMEPHRAKVLRRQWRRQRDANAALKDLVRSLSEIVKATADEREDTYGALASNSVNYARDLLKRAALAVGERKGGK